MLPPPSSLTITQILCLMRLCHVQSTRDFTLMVLEALVKCQKSVSGHGSVEIGWTVHSRSEKHSCRGGISWGLVCEWGENKTNVWHLHYSSAFRPSTMVIRCAKWPRKQAHEVRLELIHLRGTQRNCSPTSSEASWSDCSIWSGSSPGCLLCPTRRRHRDRPRTC